MHRKNKKSRKAQLAIAAIACLTLASGCLARSPGAQATARNPYHLILSDGFNGSALNTATWSKGWLNADNQIIQPTNSYEIDCYDPANDWVSSGYLHLRFYRKTETCNGTTKKYAGASVVSYGKFSFTYGKISARMRLTGTQNEIYDWPNFWANGKALNWPADGELDVFEGLSGKACWHFHSNAGGPGNCEPSRNGWHVFTAYWSPGKITWWYDGQKVGTLTTGITDQPMYLAFQNTNGFNNGRLTGPLHSPATVLVDYVKVWQR